MKSGLDPSVLQLFADQRRQQDAGQFIAQVVAGIEREERRRVRRRSVGLVVVLLVAGLALPWMTQALSFMVRELTHDMQLLQGVNFGPQWLLLTLMCVATFGFGAVWRMLRNAS